MRSQWRCELNVVDELVCELVNTLVNVRNMIQREKSQTDLLILGGIRSE
jgi:hypothetical protein